MPNFCGCTGDYSVKRVHWPWLKHGSSSARRSTSFGKSFDGTDVPKSPSLAKPEVDDTKLHGNSIPSDALRNCRSPVTFELGSKMDSIEDENFAEKNHSSDLDMDNIERKKIATIFNSKSARLSGRFYSSHKVIPFRRGSVMVRSGRPLPASILMNQQSIDSSKTSAPGTASMDISITPNGDDHASKERFQDDLYIVTPFAQILAGLRSVHANITWLTSQLCSNSALSSDKSLPPSAPVNDSDCLAEVAKKELEWCLQQLENIQTKRPVSDMARTKFKRLLSQRLDSFSSTNKGSNQISEFISKTFMDVNSEQGDSGEDVSSSCHALALGSEALESSQVDITGYSLQYSDDGIESRVSKKDHCEAFVTDSAHTIMEANVEIEGLQSSKSKQDNLPYHGIETSDDETIQKELTESLDCWNLNMFTIDILSGQHSLTVVAYRIFMKRGLFRTFNINSETFVTYILRLEAAYHRSNPYHNHIHAADVLQAVHVLLNAETLANVFNDIEILSSLFASAIHDVHHPGVTNQFLINTGHKLALLYNDASVLENHHLSVAFQLLTEQGCDIFANLTAKQRQFLRRLVIELVLATDMSKHVDLLAELRTMVETKELTGAGYLSLNDHNDRSLVLQCMLHCADLSSPTRPFDIYKQWTFGVMEEFFKQGDKEKKLGIEVSAMCDRDSVQIDKAQIGFIDFVIHPLWETWCDLIHPAGEHILEALDSNRDIILNQSPFKDFENRSKNSENES